MTSGPTSAMTVVSETSARGGVEIAGDGCGLGSAGACVLDCTDDVGGAAAGRDADDDVFASGAAAGDVALAELGGVFVDVGCGGQGLGATGHDVLDLGWGGGEGGGTLGGVEGGDASTGAGADVDETAAVAERSGDGVDDDGDLGQRLLDGCGDLGVFVVDDARDLKSRLGVEAFGGDV